MPSKCPTCGVLLAPRRICVGCQYRDRPQELQREFEQAWRDAQFARETLRDRFAAAALVMRPPEEAYEMADLMIEIRKLSFTDE